MQRSTRSTGSSTAPAPAPAPVEAPVEEVVEAPVETVVESADTLEVLTEDSNICEGTSSAPNASAFSPLWALLGLLAGLLAGTVGGLRMFMRNGHKWPTKVRRVIAGPNHHHRLDEMGTSAEDNSDDTTADEATNDEGDSDIAADTSAE